MQQHRISAAIESSGCFFEPPHLGMVCSGHMNMLLLQDDSLPSFLLFNLSARTAMVPPLSCNALHFKQGLRAPHAAAGRMEGQGKCRG